MATMTYSAEPTDDTPAQTNENRSPRLVIWLVVAALAILLLPLYMISSTIKGENAGLETQLASVQTKLAATPQPQTGEKALKDKLLMVQKQVAALEALQPSLTINRVDWLTTMKLIATYNPERIKLIGLSQPDTRLLLSGQADEESTVIAYADWLRDSQYFKRVVVQSITLRVVAPTASPSGKTVDRTVDTKPPSKFAEFTISLEFKTDTATPTR